MCVLLSIKHSVRQKSRTVEYEHENFEEIYPCKRLQKSPPEKEEAYPLSTNSSQAQAFENGAPLAPRLSSPPVCQRGTPLDPAVHSFRGVLRCGGEALPPGAQVERVVAPRTRSVQPRCEEEWNSYPLPEECLSGLGRAPSG